MNEYLNFIIKLIAGVAIVGGFVCMLASLYSNVERKRRSLAVLRLLGVSGFTLPAFSLTAGLITTSLGFGFALLVYHAVANYLNSSALGFTLPGEKICVLSYSQQMYSFIFALAISVIAGLAASRRSLKIEPSEGLRDE